jgi:hypothetical protein
MKPCFYILTGTVLLCWASAAWVLIRSRLESGQIHDFFLEAFVLSVAAIVVSSFAILAGSRVKPLQGVAWASYCFNFVTLFASWAMVISCFIIYKDFRV